MADTSTYKVQFANVSKAEADAYAADLADYLRSTVPQQDLKVDRERTSATSQDFGATLVLVLGTAAVTAVAKGVQAWLKAHTGTSIDITTPDGVIVVKNADAKSAAEIAKAWAPRKG